MCLNKSLRTHGNAPDMAAAAAVYVRFRYLEFECSSEIGVSSKCAVVGGQAAKLSSLVAARVASALELGDRHRWPERSADRQLRKPLRRFPFDTRI
jgi:hypothetical protein